MLIACAGFLIAFLLIFFQVPIAMALGFVGFCGYAFISGWTPAVSMVATITRDSTLVYTLIVLPLFVLMGSLIAGAGISADLFRIAQAMMGRRRGGVAMATVAACGGFAALCGSSVATAATMGKVVVPDMRRLGYADSLSAATVAAGGTLGVLVPPSIILVVYGVATQTHIGMLFAAGIVPGIIAVLGYMLAVRFSIWRNPAVAPQGNSTLRVSAAALLKSVWPVILIFGVVMGGIYGGLFTPIEASGIGAASALVFVITRRDLDARRIYSLFADAAQTAGMMFAIILGAAIFGEFVNKSGIGEGLLNLVKGSGLPPFGVIMLLVVLYILLGSVLESLSLILLTVPIFFPVIQALGYDPVWFGILIAVVIEVGLIHPPIGVNLFVIRSVIPDIEMMTLVKGVIPFIVSDLIRVFLIAAVPAISLWLPHLLFKSAAG